LQEHVKGLAIYNKIISKAKQTFSKNLLYGMVRQVWGASLHNQL